MQLPVEFLTIKLFVGGVQVPPRFSEAVPRRRKLPLDLSIQAATLLLLLFLTIKSFPSGEPTLLSVMLPLRSTLPRESIIVTFVFPSRIKKHFEVELQVVPLVEEETMFRLLLKTVVPSLELLLGVTATLQFWPADIS